MINRSAISDWFLICTASSALKTTALQKFYERPFNLDKDTDFFHKYHLADFFFYILERGELGTTETMESDKDRAPFIVRQENYRYLRSYVPPTKLTLVTDKLT
ncbi:hypothetical protein BCR42DRAFT_478277 [Absidia repens]|uniref:Uncharacterized protein n=1 Tax=Absidia repens TaxID=90262 RepID=A0A1X2H722_9FUNG|nr:hypothetical protein BCR42DRAFT_478277 [Absidia repens]